MKIVLAVLLVIVLTGCVAPNDQAALPPQPVVVNITVVAPTEQQQAEAMPTDLPPVATEQPAVNVPEATATPIPEAAVTPTGAPAVGAAVFADFARTGDAFSLKCAPSEITFSVKSINSYITGAQFYYRMVDKLNSISSSWYAAGEMSGDGNGNYSIEFSALDVNSDVRYDHGWFEYQFVGINKTGDVVGRSEKFQKQVTFTKDCP